MEIDDYTVSHENENRLVKPYRPSHPVDCNEDIRFQCESNPNEIDVSKDARDNLPIFLGYGKFRLSIISTNSSSVFDNRGLNSFSSATVDSNWPLQKKIFTREASVKFVTEMMKY